MKDRMNSKITESRSRLFSPTSQQLSSLLSSNQVTQSATQLITVQLAEDKRCPPSLLSPLLTSFASQNAHKEKNKQLLQQIVVENTTEKQEQQSLYQATVGGPTKNDSSISNSNSTLSIISRLCIAHLAIYLSNTLLLAYLLDYIKYSKDIEVIE